MEAIAGENLRHASEVLRWADALDDPGVPQPAARPAPCPPRALRPSSIAVTQADRLAADPYAYYAARILKLQKLEMVDADPGPAWRGTLVHRALELWFREDKCDPEKLVTRTADMVGGIDSHPIVRALWLPRVLESVRWLGEQVAQDAAVGRHIVAVETKGEMMLGGITVNGTADRIDRMVDGSFGIVDYKTGKPPGAKQVFEGFALQLGLLGAIAEAGGFVEVKTGATASAFEYWSLAKGRSGFGYRISPVKPGGGEKTVGTEQLVSHATDKFLIAAGKWLTGEEPFTAQLNPELPSYGEYDQLMRLEEWYGRAGGTGGEI
jgi:ATP-dependent helicase/nuclease subunit B